MFYLGLTMMIVGSCGMLAIWDGWRRYGTRQMSIELAAREALDHHRRNQPRRPPDGSRGEWDDWSSRELYLRERKQRLATWGGWAAYIITGSR